MPSRNELYLMKIAGEEVELPPLPLSRIETYLAFLAGEDVTLPDEILSRNEAYLAKCCGVDTELPPEPLSETERLLAILAGEDVEEPEATTRINVLLATIIENGGFSPDEPDDPPAPEPEYAFRKLMNMETTSYIDSAAMKTLGDYVFSYDIVIEEAVFPAATMLPTSCFEYATAVKRVVFPEATRCSSSRGFIGCSSLEELRMPKCTSSMSNTLATSALANLRILETKASSFNLSMSTAAKLETVILRATSKVSGTPTFNANSPIGKGTGQILVPENLVNTYKTATGWSNYASIISAIPADEG